MMTATAPVLDRLQDLADSTRRRLLLALEARELAVAELQAVLQLAQSTTSRHLKVLADGGWIESRSEGASTRYRFDPEGLPRAAGELWALVRREVEGSRVAAGDRERIAQVLAERHRRSRDFFATEAGKWDHLRDELFGRRSEFQALLGLLDARWVVGDLGCGSGHLTAAMAPFVTRVVAVDESPAMLEAARARCASLPSAEFRQGELELLPVREAELDLAVMALVLPYVPVPGRVLAEAAMALQPGGRLVVMDLQPHDRAEYAQTMGHLWQGLDASQMKTWLTGAGLMEARYVPLPPDTSAQGPGLFVATARKPG
jgi:SAM-dependent methyltransferase